MPVVVFPEIRIISPCLWTVEVDPEQFPGIFVGADVGVFARTVEEETVPGMGSRGDHAALRSWFAVGHLPAAGEHHKKQVGV